MSVASVLDERGFVVLDRVITPVKLVRLAKSYDEAVASASPDDVKVGSTTTRVTDFVNRGPDFDSVYVLPALLEAARQTIGQDFKLSSLHARTLRPHAEAGDWHVDVDRGSSDWPLVGFILMVDAFTADNGATRFVPGTHRWRKTPQDSMQDCKADNDDQVLACGPAGSLLIFNGSTWHGHTANRTDRPRRSLQGAFIPVNGQSATDLIGRMTAETRKRLGPAALRVLGLQS
jgi:ectoine hydroxylase-related dioxygenase (phytanoyl-CoA dioxygenase family)